MIAAGIQVYLYAQLVLACSCGSPPPPCGAFWQTPMVFAATVTEPLSQRDGRITRAQIRIDKADRGVTEKTSVLVDDGMCDGPTLEIDEQYLLYTGRSANGDIASVVAPEAESQIFSGGHFVHRKPKGSAPVGILFGSVAVLKLHGPERTYTRAADGDGRYVFKGLDPSQYEITAIHPGYRMVLFSPYGTVPSALVAGRGCAVVNLVLRKRWLGAIAGRLIRSDGSPGPARVIMHLLRVEQREGRAVHHPVGWGITTNENGEYSFDEVAEGRYGIVMNLYMFPTVHNQYPTLYWPSALNESEAPIFCGEGSRGRTAFRFQTAARAQERARKRNRLGNSRKASGWHQRSDHCLTGSQHRSRGI
jgi:hypothetical protein